MTSIYILTEITSPEIKSQCFSASWRVMGYYTSFEKAAEAVRKWVDVDLDDEDDEEDGSYPISYTCGFLIEQKELDDDSLRYHKKWLFDAEGNLADQTFIDYYEETLYRGRPADTIRFKVGDIVQTFEHRTLKSRIGIITDVPPTPQNYKEYDQSHPFLDWVGDEDCFEVTYGSESVGMECPVDIVLPCSEIPDKIKQHLAKFLKH